MTRNIIVNFSSTIGSLPVEIKKKSVFPIFVENYCIRRKYFYCVQKFFKQVRKHGSPRTFWEFFHFLKQFFQDKFGNNRK